jgi:hypothetical protein
MTHKPTDQNRRTVEAMSGYGLPQDAISRLIGVSEPTLRKHYATELHNGMTKANAAVARSLYEKATGPGKEGVVAAIFWLKCRAGWNDKAGELPVLGKKEQQALAARQPAPAESDWGDDLNVIPLPVKPGTR